MSRAGPWFMLFWRAEVIEGEDSTSGVLLHGRELMYVVFCCTFESSSILVVFDCQC
jgi:hypothetical protein